MCSNLVTGVAQVHFPSSMAGPPGLLSDYMLAIEMPLVDAIIFLQPRVTDHHESTIAAARSHHHNSIDNISLPPKHVPHSKSGATRTADKLFPIPLLKCPKHAFKEFCETYTIHPDTIKALLAARCRKVNRKWKRVSRCKGKPIIPNPADHESDSEGDCATLDGASVFIKLTAMSQELDNP